MAKKNGIDGPITKAIRDEFHNIVNAKMEDGRSWLTPVPVKQPVAV